MYGVVPRGAQVAQPLTVLAPIKGWNTRDALAEMDPQAAFQLDNWFPRPDKVVSRGGCKLWATGLGGPVESVMEYVKAGVHTLFAAASGKIFDVTAAGASVTALGGLTSARLQHVEFSGPGGQFLYTVNGVDSPHYWDGAAWTVPAITGADQTKFIGVNVYRGRLFFVSGNSTKFAYLGIGAIAGVALEYDCGQFLGLGGALMACGTWTVDGGSGPDDLFVIISSEGEVIVFQGTDPSMSTNWQMIQRFVVGKPLGRRCFMRYGGRFVHAVAGWFLPRRRSAQGNKHRSAGAGDLRRYPVDVRRFCGGLRHAVRLAGDLFSAGAARGDRQRARRRDGRAVLSVRAEQHFEQMVPVYQSIGGATRGRARGCCSTRSRFSATVSATYGSGRKPAQPTTMRRSPARRGRRLTISRRRASINRMMMLRPRVSSPGTPSLSIALDVDFKINYPNLSAVSFPPVGLAVGRLGVGRLTVGRGRTDLFELVHLRHDRRGLLREDGGGDGSGAVVVLDAVSRRGRGARCDLDCAR